MKTNIKVINILNKELIKDVLSKDILQFILNICIYIVHSYTNIIFM